MLSFKPTFSLCFFSLLLGRKAFALIHGANIPGSYAILLFTASDLASITRHIHNWVLFLLWLHLFIPPGVISPLIHSVSYLLPFHTVHGVLKARILKRFAIPFSSGPHSVRPLHHDPPVLGGNPSKMVGVARGHQRADTLKPYSHKTSQSNHTRTTALSNSMKPSHACGATQEG